MNAKTIQRIDELMEGCELEAKAAQGRHGRGELPRSLWETLSAFANARGGWLVLGVSEDMATGRLTPIGVQEPERLIRDLWDALRQQQMLRPNLLTEQDVYTIWQDQAAVVVVRVPAAPLELRPVYVGPDPWTGTYVRRGQGDHRCTPAQVRRMMERASAARAHAALALTPARAAQLRACVQQARQAALAAQGGQGGLPGAAAPDADALHVDALIVTLCSQHPLTATQLAHLMDMPRATLKARHLGPLVRLGRLKRLYEDRLTHPGQRYITPGGASPEDDAPCGDAPLTPG